MFSSLGWPEILIIVVAGLIILGPERIPGAIKSTMDTIKKARSYLNDATEKIQGEFGPEFESFKEPISQLQELRNLTPMGFLSKQLNFDESEIKNNSTSIGSSGLPKNQGEADKSINNLLFDLEAT